MNDMRPHHQPGLPVMPDADDVMTAIRRLDLSGPRELDDLGPSAEAGVSGRTASAVGPLVSPPLRDLGLLLDDTLIDNLLMSEGPQVSIPVEMALDALAGTEGRARASTADTLGARWRLTSWSGREERRERPELTATLVPSPPAFLTEWPIRPRRPRAPSRFPWDLLGVDRRPPPLDRTYEDAAAQDLWEAEAGDAAPGAAADPPPSAGSRWTSAGAGAVPDPDARVHTAEDTAGIEKDRDRREREAACAIAEASRSPSPATVALASLVFPGWGQALNDERRKAAVYRFAYLATLFVAATLAWRGPIGRLAASFMSVDPAPAFAWLGAAFTTGAGLWLLSIYDALVVRIAQRRSN